MRNAIDITGMRFGRLVAVRRDGSRNGQAAWICRCDCGNETIAAAKQLRYGSTKSCGCLHLERLRTNAITHGHWNERLYGVWHSMQQRTENKTRREYKYYGGRGITVCTEWRNSYEAFRDWAYSHGYDETAARGKCTIDRINVNGNYTPENCRFVGMDVQLKNRRPRTRRAG